MSVPTAAAALAQHWSRSGESLKRINICPATDPLTWTISSRAKSQHASQQSRPVASCGVLWRREGSQLISRHYVDMSIDQDKCDEPGLSATLRHNQIRTTDQKVAGSIPAERTRGQRQNSPHCSDRTDGEVLLDAGGTSQVWNMDVSRRDCGLDVRCSWLPRGKFGTHGVAPPAAVPRGAAQLLLRRRRLEVGDADPSSPGPLDSRGPLPICHQLPEVAILRMLAAMTSRPTKMLCAAMPHTRRRVGQEEEGHQQGPQRQCPRATGSLGEQFFETLRHPRGIDHVDGKRDGFVAAMRRYRRDGPAIDHGRSEASSARRAALDPGAPWTWTE